MSDIPANPGQRERWIAFLLLYGTWFACALIAVGLLYESWDRSPSAHISGDRITHIGIGALISLPILRVLLLLALFLRERDYIYTLVAAVVLGIIAAGFLIGIEAH